MRELLLTCLEDEAEQLSDVLLELGALSVSVEDADGDTEAEQALFGEPGMEPEVYAWNRNRVVALLPDSMDVDELVHQLLLKDMVDERSLDWSVREVPDTDWVRLTQSQFGPIEVGERILIVPSWHQDDVLAEPVPGRIQIQLDPGLAFGTGSHSTTHLCLEWLADKLPAGASVLDYGCGSGILAIAAKKLGAAQTLATDIDEQAVNSTRYNAQVNQVDVQAYLPDDLPASQSQVVVANILSNPLKVLAPMLANRVQSGGFLVLSGIFAWQAQEMIEAYAEWIPMEVWREREGWVCLSGRRP